MEVTNNPWKGQTSKRVTWKNLVTTRPPKKDCTPSFEGKYFRRRPKGAMVPHWVGKLSSMPWGCEFYVWRWHQHPRHETRHEALRWKAASYHRSGRAAGAGARFFHRNCVTLTHCLKLNGQFAPLKIDLWPTIPTGNCIFHGGETDAITT